MQEYSFGKDVGYQKNQPQVCYELVDTCQQMLQQSYALMEDITVWIEFLKREDQESDFSDINTTQELQEGLCRLGISTKKEAQFLEGLLQNEEKIQPFHVNGSNLPYLEAVYRCARQETGLMSIFKSVKYTFFNEKSSKNGNTVQKTKTEKYRVDVVSCHGSKWIKVSARNARWLLSQDSVVDSSFDDSMGSDSVPLESKAKIMLQAASQNQVHFQIPKVSFQFSCFGEQNEMRQTPLDIPTSLFGRLNEMGVSVEEIQPILLRDGFNTYSWQPDSSKLATATLNLDITTLLALASHLTHNGNMSELHPDPLRKANDSLKIQLQQEKCRPIMPLLVHYLRGRALTTTQSCYNKFTAIVNTLAGPEETLRARILFRTHHNDALLTQHDLDGRDDDPFKQWKISMGTRAAPDVQVLPDSPSPVFLALTKYASLRNFSDIHISAFGSGHHRKLTTVTANVGVARCLINTSASHEHPLDFPDGDYFLLHEPRSLAENKLISVL